MVLVDVEVEDDVSLVDLEEEDVEDEDSVSLPPDPESVPVEESLPPPNTRRG